MSSLFERDRQRTQEILARRAHAETEMFNAVHLLPRPYKIPIQRPGLEYPRDPIYLRIIR